jgi:hypothetical protein
MPKSKAGRRTEKGERRKGEREKGERRKGEGARENAEGFGFRPFSLLLSPFSFFHVLLTVFSAPRAWSPRP